MVHVSIHFLFGHCFCLYGDSGGGAGCIRLLMMLVYFFDNKILIQKSRSW